jgi:hypothetical protein
MLLPQLIPGSGLLLIDVNPASNLIQSVVSRKFRFNVTLIGLLGKQLTVSSASAGVIDKLLKINNVKIDNIEKVFSFQFKFLYICKN